MYPHLCLAGRQFVFLEILGPDSTTHHNILEDKDNTTRDRQLGGV